MAVDERLISALHVEVLRAGEDSAHRSGHEVFQASTIAALLDGAYDGDETFAELGRHGDLGLGTLNGCDGEMIAVDGEFFRADVEGDIHPVPPTAKTPFAVLTFFEAHHSFRLDGRLSHERMLERVDGCAGHPEQIHAVRIDGRFERVRARSVPKQHLPYRPLVEVVADQRVFELEGVEGTMVGFRFPDYAEGVNVPGYHLHFIDSARARGGHVLECVPDGVDVAVDDSVDLHAELPPGVRLDAPGDGPGDALDRVEHRG